MRGWLFAAAIVMVLAGVVSVLLTRRRKDKRPVTRSIRVARAAKTAAAFAHRADTDGSYAVLTTDVIGGDGAPGFTQVSRVDGRLAVDHVLGPQINKNSAASFRELAQRFKLDVTECEFNGARCLRVHTDDVGELCQAVLTEVFALTPGDKLEVFVEIADSP